ncbi:MAG: RNA-binding protein [Gammaproteobacteria bacterium]|nr:RNA-binding protein [Gammaproteobacteria bacterium]HJN96669.1 ribosome-associated heat shock protein Hsp15 [Gammaproteobacteria bacterium]
MTASSKSRSGSKQLTRVRLDKWLWAARFYKTRAIAKQAIEGGKVHCEGARSKPSKEIEVGMQLKLRQSFDEKTVLVKALSEQRRPAPEAQLLYAETPLSIANREQLAEQRRAQPRHWPTATKPNKKQRRMIQRFKQGDSS